jgi:AcrR family transcriptional regulator
VLKFEQLFNMSKIDATQILKAAGDLFAKEGFVTFSVRTVAKELQIAPSLIYYYFKNEEELLLSMFHYLNKQLGQRRAVLPKTLTAKEMLKQRIEFQIDNQQAIVAVLKYYLRFRKTFPKFKEGFLPDKSSLHVEEVLRYGVQTGEFTCEDVNADAKVITHAINGYLLEFYPYVVTKKEKKALVEKIYSFILRAVRTA